MYFGNLSNFFYKDKNWLFKQPKISIHDNKNHNIIKIGRKYYTLDNLTGKLKLIIINNVSKIINEESNEKKNNDFFPKIFRNYKINKNNCSYNTHSKTNYENNSSNNQLLSIYSSINEEKNKSKDINNTYDYSLSNKEELNLLNNSNINIKENNAIIEAQEKPKFEFKKFDRINSKFKNDLLRAKLNFKKNNTKAKDNKKMLSKRNIKKILDKRQKSLEGLKTAMTVNSNSNNNTLISINKSLNDKNNRRKISINDIKQLDYTKAFFPNDKSLKIKSDDSWLLKTIKNQIYKDRVFNNLKKQYQFYEDSNNKREHLEIPKFNFKKTMLLNKNVIFPSKESIYHKIYFDYVNKQRKNDKDNKIKYPFVVDDKK